MKFVTTQFLLTHFVLTWVVLTQFVPMQFMLNLFCVLAKYAQFHCANSAMTFISINNCKL